VPPPKLRRFSNGSPFLCVSAFLLMCRFLNRMMSKGRAFEQDSSARGNGVDGYCFALSGGDKSDVEVKLSYLALRNRWKKRR
jgi:hypothetical protein